MLAEPASEAEFPPSRVDGDVEAAEFGEGSEDQDDANEVQEGAHLTKDLIDVRHVNVRFRLKGV